MGVPESGLLAAFRDASEHPTKWIETAPDRAPVRQVTVDKPDLLKLFPIPRHNEHDSAQYITAGVIVARNPRNGAQNVSIQRIQAAINLPVLRVECHGIKTDPTIVYNTNFIAA